MLFSQPPVRTTCTAVNKMAAKQLIHNSVADFRNVKDSLLAKLSETQPLKRTLLVLTIEDWCFGIVFVRAFVYCSTLYYDNSHRHRLVRRALTSNSHYEDGLALRLIHSNLKALQQ